MASKAKGRGAVNKPVTGTSDQDDIDLGSAEIDLKINGGDGADTIVAGIGNDHINAGDGDDTITGGLGDDTIFGNGGYDTAVFSGSILNFSWAEAKGNRLLVSGQDGNDTLKHIDVLQFDDFSIYTNANNGPVSVLRTDPMVTDENGTFDISVDLYDFDGDAITLSGYSVTSDGAVTVQQGAAVQAAVMGTSVGLEFTFDPGTLYDYLAVGEATTETLTLSYMDSNGAIDTVSHTFTISGVNDGVVITSSAQSAGVTERVDNAADENAVPHSVGDMISFDDVDLSDTHSVTVTPNDGAGSFRGTFTASVLTDSTGTGSGQVGWTFDIDDAALEDLAEGQELTQTYTVTIDDGFGGAASQDVTVTLTGANDGPTAVDDLAAAYEDELIFIDVLANDLDPDVQDSHQIVSAQAASGAMVSIVDGQISYQGNADYSGTDTITYTMTDGLAQSTATATVEVAAVADAPTLTLETLSGGTPTETIIRVTANVSDTDGSEVLDRLEFSAIDADGNPVDLSAYGISPVFDPVTDGGTVSQDFVLSLPPNQSHNFDLTVTAVAQELSNGDEATASESLTFETTYSSVSVDPYFALSNASIWSPGGAYSASGNYVLSPELDEDGRATVGIFGPIDLTVAGVGLTSHFSADVSADVEMSLDLNNSFSVNGGSLDGGLQYHGDMESWYNSGTDVLTIQTTGWADPAASVFNASIPQLGFEQELTGFDLDVLMRFVFWGYIHFHTGFASPGLTIDYGALGAGVDIDVNLDGYLSANPFSLIEFDGNQFSFLNGAYSTSFASFANDYVSAWATVPNFDVQSTGFNGDTLTGFNWQNFANVTFDLDAIGALIAGYPNDPLTQDFSVGVPGVSIGAEATAADYSLLNNLSYSQYQELDLGDLIGTIVFEDGAEYDFVFDEDFSVLNASQHDANGDGEIEYSLILDTNAELYTQSTIGLHMYDYFTAVYAYVFGGIDAGPISESIGVDLGPAFEAGGLAINQWLGHSFAADFALDIGAITVDDFVFV